MKIINNKLLPFGKNFIAINLFGVIFAKQWLNTRDLNHERIHTLQQREMLFLFFYLWYFVEWLVRLLQFRNFVNAYANISFEREAYANMDNLSYCKKRYNYAWCRYLCVY